MSPIAFKLKILVALSVGDVREKFYPCCLPKIIILKAILIGHSIWIFYKIAAEKRVISPLMITIRLEESNIIPCEKVFYGCERLMNPKKIKAINPFYIYHPVYHMTIAKKMPWLFQPTAI